MAETVLKVSSPAAVIDAVPHLVGFQPVNSLVILGLSGPRRRVAVTMRGDLLAEADDRQAVADYLERFTRTPISEAIVVVYADAAETAASLPRRRLVLEVERALQERGISLRDALCVRAGRWWSYLCGDAACCPSEGTPLPADTAPPSALATAFAVERGSPLASREEVVASLAPDVPSGLAAEIRALVAAVGSQVPSVPVDLLIGTAQAQLGATGAVGREHVAALLAAVQDVTVRDAVCMHTSREELTTAVQLWALLMRQCPPPYDAQVGAVLAVLAYRCGDGCLARTAAERALQTAPSHRLAGYLLTALDAGLPPSLLEGDPQPRRNRRAGAGQQRKAARPGGSQRRRRRAS